MSNISYSIIIPHKNIPKLLRRCLDSIPRREDIQIIVVDDNSDPTKVNFDSFPGVGESCVEVYFTKEGKGAGYARNVGVSKAKGRWLLFADADDFYNPCFLESIDKYKDADVDLVYFNANSVDTYTLESAHRTNFYNSLMHDCFLHKDDNYKLQRLKVKYHTPWAKLFKHSLVIDNKVKFSEVMFGNDIVFVVECALKSRKVDISLREIYCCTVRAESLIQDNNLRVRRTRISQLIRANQLLEKENINIRFSYKKWHRWGKDLVTLKELYLLLYICFKDFQMKNSIYMLKSFVKWIIRHPVKCIG